MEQQIFNINTLRKKAEKYASEVRTNEEIFKEDITKLLENEVRYQIRNEEIVIIEVKGKPRTSKCQPEGSKVLMANGEFINIEDTKVGDSVISFNKDKEIVFSKIIDKNKIKDKIYNIKDTYGNILYKCTGEHKVPVMERIHPRKKNEEMKDIDNFCNGKGFEYHFYNFTEERHYCYKKSVLWFEVIKNNDIYKIK